MMPKGRTTGECGGFWRAAARESRHGRGAHMESRKPATDLNLCKDLTVKYTVTVTKESSARYKATGGYVNHIRFYLYSSNAKKQVGKDITASLMFTQKQFAAAKGKRPKPRELTDRQVQKHFVHLIQKNRGMSERVKNCKGREAELDLNQLFVYWMVQSGYLQNQFWPTTEKWNDACQRFAVLSRTLGSFDLSTLLVNEREQQRKVVQTLSQATRNALDKESDEKSATMWQYGRVIAAVITTYLNDHDRSAATIVDMYRHDLLPKRGVMALITRAMRTRVFPRNLYRQIYAQTAGKAKPSHEDIGLMLMIFLGLTAEEACGLNRSDCQQIPNFRTPVINAQPYMHLYVTKRYEKVPNTKRKYELTEIMDSVCSYRVIPLPSAVTLYINPLLGKEMEQSDEEPPVGMEQNAEASQVEIAQSKEKPLLCDANGDRLRPDVLEGRLKELFEAEPQCVTVQLENGKEKTVDLALTPDMYQQSCRHFWQYYCGLTQGEIRYLAGLTPQDTAARHYIDFNNDREQFRMAKQLEYGLAMLANVEQTEMRRIRGRRHGKIGGLYMGGIDKRVHVRIVLRRPRRLRLQSNRGLKLYKVKAGEEQQP